MPAATSALTVIAAPASVKSAAVHEPATAPGSFVTLAIDAVTVPTWIEPEFVLSNVPLIVCAVSPGYIAVSEVVWLTVSAVVVPAEALPLPEPPAVQ